MTSDELLKKKKNNKNRLITFLTYTGIYSISGVMVFNATFIGISYLCMYNNFI